jgi:glycerol uptake operon antiterminator
MQVLGTKTISTKNKRSEPASGSTRDLRSILEQSRIIPAIRSPEHVAGAIASPSSVIFLMCGTPSTIGSLIWRLNDMGKMPIVNLDLLSGLARDSHAVEFLADAGAAGVISTHQDILRAARALGLISIQRTFAIDSAAINSCLSRFKHFVPDVMELLPAVAGPIVLPKVRDAFPDLLIIGCGLVTSIKQIDDMVQQGVTSISASDPALWVL